MAKILTEEKLYAKRNARIGVLGGTFDPPHLAHIHMAKSTKEALKLDYVVFMPLGVPPHDKTGISSVHHRINMLNIILSKYDDFYIDAYEVLLEKPSYTVNSVERIEKLLGENSKMFFIIGADSLMYLEKWYDAKKLFKITDFAVVPRAGYEKNECLERIEKLAKEYNASIFYVDTQMLDYSSTDIRNNLFANVLSTTTEKIYKYIKENDLYNSQKS